MEESLYIHNIRDMKVTKKKRRKAIVFTNENTVRRKAKNPSKPI